MSSDIGVEETGILEADLPNFDDGVSIFGGTSVASEAMLGERFS